MAKNSTEGNRARTARYRAGLAARGIRPVQLYAPEEAHALLRQAAGLMTREQDPLEPHQAMRHASGANDPGQGHGDQDGREQTLAAALAATEAVRAELTQAREAERQAKRGQVEAMCALGALQAEAEALQARERAAQEAADGLRDELAGIRNRGGWRGALIRLAGI